ncbi:alanine:cation symporter family protein [Salicola sp. Rm-C-2C1-2]|uniref:alanine:cation symporter family protein n=1 Tax=Salicola sp. Rm-C-2C1-2 TaxID=3141321 RepID=UPI0032E52558
MEIHLGDLGGEFIAVAIMFFAFTSIVANYSYAENALVYLGARSRGWIYALRCAALAMVIWGGYQAVITVFNTADASMGLMATVNLIAIVFLSGTVVKLTRDYLAQRKQGHIPRFRLSNYPELEDRVEKEIWE